MWNDLVKTARLWRLVHLQGMLLIRERYARSYLGQGWHTISTFLFLLAIGVIWALIWHMPISEYLPYIGVGHIVFTFVAQTINEASGIFVSDARLYLNEYMPLQISIAAHLYRKLIIFLHNIPTILFLVIWSSSTSVQLSLQFLLSCFLVIIFTYSTSYVVSVLCTRYRDLVPITALITQVAFLLSPVMWKISFIPKQYRIYSVINPFTSVLECIRNPIIGMAINHYYFFVLISWTIVMTFLSYCVYKCLNRNLVFWI